jgi:hypothetical protein
VFEENLAAIARTRMVPNRHPANSVVGFFI